MKHDVGIVRLDARIVRHKFLSDKYGDLPIAARNFRASNFVITNAYRS